MRTRRPLMSVLLAAGLVTCCASTAAANASAAARPGPAHRVARWFTPAPKLQLGIDIDFYDIPAASVSATAAAEIGYVKSLHANSVSVSFPFYVGGPHSSRAYGAPATPSPADLAILAGDAERAGLYVSFRPLMDQANVHPLWRGSWTPADPAAWFASYERFLRQYAVVAQRAHVQEFIESTELSAISNSSQWAGVDRYLRKLYHGVLAVSNNFVPGPIRRLVDKYKVVQLMDDYHPVYVPSTASVARLTRGWDAFLATEPRGVTLSEIGIAAEDNAYARPYAIAGAGAFNPAVQVHWFEAACNAIRNEHLGGLYFWTIPFGFALNQAPASWDPTSFTDGPGAAAIAACFKRLG